ncbi:MAG: ABC transporter permease [Lachnospiraceae bacterium]|nr:ABC transporter permease [Lachnospiraceae bacterium]
MKLKYVAKRLLAAVPTFFGITILAFIILNMAPGSPLDAMLADPRINAAELERKRQALGLNQPVLVQYFSWLRQFLSGNLGFSYSTQRPVAAMILERLPATALLASCSILLSLIVSIPLGIFAAAKPNSPRDFCSSGIALFMMAAPNFFVGLILIYFFAIVFQILPSGGMYDSSGTRSIADLLRHMLMPCLVLSFQQIGGWVRHMRSSMLDVMQEDYIRTARSKGLTRTAVLFRHGLKNSLIPVVTVVGMSIPSVVGGAVVTEQIFGWPGIGTLMVTAIQARDYPVIMGVTVMLSAAVLLANILTDLAYGILDPRISYK